MKRIYSLTLVFFILLSLVISGKSKWPSKVIPIQFSGKLKERKIVWSDLSKGKIIKRLTWASKSSVACFPRTQNESFRGNHVFFGTKLPPHSIMKITLNPDKKLDANLYAYMISDRDYNRIPPYISRATTCEASYNRGRKNPGGKETVMLNAIKNPYNVIIGVAGRKGYTKGKFKLMIEIQTRKEEIKAPKNMRVYVIKSKKNRTVVVKGNINKGYLIPLSWANTSSVACFPTTQNNNFKGKHVFYKTHLPRHSVMNITLIPKDPGLDLNLYAISKGLKNKKLPPFIRSANCEASYPYRRGNPGKEEKVQFYAIKNPYQVIIGVAGSENVTKGDFILKIELKTKKEEIQAPKNMKISWIKSQPNKTVAIKGNINKGYLIPLSWASTSSVACFPGTQNESFRGHHVFYGTKLPPYSIMKITLYPDKKLDANLYAYMISDKDYKRLPPKVYSATTCEASYQNGRKNPGGKETVMLNAIKNPYNVIIGVAGRKGFISGRFRLKIELQTKEKEVAVPKNIKVIEIKSQKNKVVAVSGNIDNGYRIPLSWASTSNVACFPGTQFSNFRGHHVFYRTYLPSNSKMIVTLMPKRNDLDLNLYALRLGEKERKTPPNINYASCEASFSYNKGNPGKIEKVEFFARRYRYQILIAVAGPKDIKKGDFTLKIEIKPW